MIINFLFITMSALVIWLCYVDNRRINEHRKEIADLQEKYFAREKELLDRIMANNIHEFKAATGAAPVKKSDSGNFLVDRMEKSLKKQYQEFE